MGKNHTAFERSYQNHNIVFRTEVNFYNDLNQQSMLFRPYYTTQLQNLPFFPVQLHPALHEPQGNCDILIIS